MPMEHAKSAFNAGRDLVGASAAEAEGQGSGLSRSIQGIKALAKSGTYRRLHDELTQIVSQVRVTAGSLDVDSESFASLEDKYRESLVSGSEEEQRLAAEQLDALNNIKALLEGSGDALTERILDRDILNNEEAAETLKYMRELVSNTEKLGSDIRVDTAAAFDNFTDAIRDQRVSGTFRADIVKSVAASVADSGLFRGGQAAMELTSIAEGVDDLDKGDATERSVAALETMRDKLDVAEQIHEFASSPIEEMQEKELHETLANLVGSMRRIDGFVEEQTQLSRLMQDDLHGDQDRMDELRMVMSKLADRTVEAKTLFTLDQLNSKFDAAILDSDDLEEALVKGGLGKEFLENAKELTGRGGGGGALDLAILSSMILGVPMEAALLGSMLPGGVGGAALAGMAGAKGVGALWRGSKAAASGLGGLFGMGAGAGADKGMGTGGGDAKGSAKGMTGAFKSATQGLTQKLGPVAKVLQHIRGGKLLLGLAAAGLGLYSLFDFLSGEGDGEVEGGTEPDATGDTPEESAPTEQERKEGPTGGRSARARPQAQDVEAADTAPDDGLLEMLPSSEATILATGAGLTTAAVAKSMTDKQMKTPAKPPPVPATKGPMRLVKNLPKGVMRPGPLAAIFGAFEMMTATSEADRVRALLSAGGGALGGTLGSAAGPLGTLGGGFVGYELGDQLADWLIEQGMVDTTPFAEKEMEPAKPTRHARRQDKLDVSAEPMDDDVEPPTMEPELDEARMAAAAQPVSTRYSRRKPRKVQAEPRVADTVVAEAHPQEVYAAEMDITQPPTMEPELDEARMAMLSATVSMMGDMGADEPGTGRGPGTKPTPSSPIPRAPRTRPRPARVPGVTGDDFSIALVNGILFQ